MICTALVFYCLIPEAAALPKQSKKTSSAAVMWVLQQTHPSVGKEEIYIAPDGAKIVNCRSGYELLCKAPKWEVHGFRRSEKLEWIAPLSLFDGILIQNPNAEPHMNKSIYVAKSHGNLLGLSYTHFTPRTQSRSAVDGTTDIATAPEVLEFLCRCYRCPNTHSVPLTIRSEHGTRKLPKFKMGQINTGMGNDLRSGLVEELTTQSCKKIPYSADILALPVHFKRTMSLPQVTFSPDMKSQFDEVFSEGTGFRGELH